MKLIVQDCGSVFKLVENRLVGEHEGILASEIATVNVRNLSADRAAGERLAHTMAQAEDAVQLLRELIDHGGIKSDRVGFIERAENILAACKPPKKKTAVEKLADTFREFVRANIERTDHRPVVRLRCKTCGAESESLGEIIPHDDKCIIGALAIALAECDADTESKGD